MKYCVWTPRSNQISLEGETGGFLDEIIVIGSENISVMIYDSKLSSLYFFEASVFVPNLFRCC